LPILGKNFSNLDQGVVGSAAKWCVHSSSVACDPLTL
jgi:hypothetical protein